MLTPPGLDHLGSVPALVVGHLSTSGYAGVDLRALAQHIDAALGQ